MYYSLQFDFYEFWQGIRKSSYCTWSEGNIFKVNPLRVPLAVASSSGLFHSFTAPVFVKSDT